MQALRAPLGRTLGNWIVIEDDELEVKEEEWVLGVIYDLFEIDD